MMKHFGIHVIVVLSLIGGTRASGNRYVLPALGLGGSSDENNVKIQYMLTNRGANQISPTATLDNNSTNIQSSTNTVGRDEVRLIVMENFQEGALLIRSELANKSIIVETPNDDFILHVVYEKNGYDEGYAAISTFDIGNEYYVSTFCALGGFCQVAIASVTPGLTRVYVKLPSEVDEVVICVGDKSWRSKYHTSVNLTYPESIQIETTHDLTGTYIYADNPISVIAGTHSMSVHGSGLVHFMEQLTPVSQWGYEFIIRGFETAYGLVIHITSSEPKTFVEMSGFKTVEMTVSGQTLRRRLEESTVSYIKSTKPVQVMVYVGITFGSYDPIYSVGMTTIPAVEHFLTLYVYNAFNGPTFFQYVINDGETLTCQSNAMVTKVPYTLYQVNTLNQSASDTSTDKVLTTTDNTRFGGVFMLNYSVFPLAPPLIVQSVTSCSTSIFKSTVGDGIDNDCDGDVDEDYCFENAKITSTFIPDVTGQIPAYTADVTDFYELLFRVQTCETVQIELSDTSTGKIVIHIAWSQITIYKCFPHCDSMKTINTTNILYNTNCKGDVISYWILQNQNKFCIGIGRRNHIGFCNGDVTDIQLSSALVGLRLSGLMSNATIWYDWRCQDAVSNCNKYPSDLCTNQTFNEWVNLNCRQFCGICSPDNEGRIFVYHPAPWNSVEFTQNLKILGSTEKVPLIGVETGSEYITSIDLNIVDGQTNLSYSKFHVQDVTKPVYIFTDDDSIVYFNIESNGKQSRLLQPLDAIGNEYMTISLGTSDLQCSVVTVEIGTSVTVFTGSQTLVRNSLESFSEIFTATKTGNLFTGDKPFALFCGTDAGSEFGMSWFQVPATKTWGTYYITPTLGTANTTGEMRAKINIVANSNNTVIEVHGDFDGIYVLLSRGDSQELETDPFVVYNITSNYPVGVAILFQYNPDSTTSFHILSPVKSFMDYPVILGNSFSVNNDVSVASTSSQGNVTQMILNTNSLISGEIYLPWGDLRTFMFYVRHLATGIDVIPSTSLYKDYSNDQICVLGVGNVGDGIDTDCDGLADEELVCYVGYGTTKEDSDYDGAFGEDCKTSEVGTASYTIPEEPQCSPVQTEQTNSSCWQNCACRCSWQTKLEEYQQMNKTAQNAYNQAEAEKYQKELEVNEETLSSHVATKQSAEDTRSSSQSIGVAGVIFILIVVCVIVIFDVISLIQKIRAKKNIVEEVQ